MNKELPELHDFFGAYFHQDWTVEHGTAEQVIDAFFITIFLGLFFVILQMFEYYETAYSFSDSVYSCSFFMLE